MKVRKDIYKVGDILEWDNVFFARDSADPTLFGKQVIVIKVEKVPEPVQVNVGHSQWVTIAPWDDNLKVPKDVNRKYSGAYFEPVRKGQDENDLFGIVKMQQTKIDNQRNEIKDLTRKYESAKRVNRGLQRKKDLRGNLIAKLTTAVYDQAYEITQAELVNELLTNTNNYILDKIVEIK